MSTTGKPSTFNQAVVGLAVITLTGIFYYSSVTDRIRNKDTTAGSGVYNLQISRVSLSWLLGFVCPTLPISLA